MEYPIQTIKRKEEFYQLCQSIHNKEQTELIKNLENIIEEENINPCQVKAPFNHSLMGFVIFQDRTVLANILSKYADDSKTPRELISVWRDIAFNGKKTYLNTFIKKGDYSNLYKSYSDGTNNLSPAVYKLVISKRTQKGYKKTVNYKSIFNDLLLFYLDKGLDINTTYKPVYQHEPFVNFLLKPFKFSKFFRNDYNLVLETVLKYGFDINKVFDIYSGNNFLQDFCSKNCTKTDNLNSLSIKTLLKIIENHNIDGDYKNKDGLNIFELLKAKELFNVSNFIKIEFEKQQIQNSLESKELHSISLKKRI